MSSLQWQQIKLLLQNVQNGVMIFQTRLRRFLLKKSVIFLLLAIIGVGFWSLFIGVKDISPADLLYAGDDEKVQVFLISRIPRLMSILCVGTALSVAGVIMQQITSNKFISPTTGSTTDWAKLGVLVAILLFPGAGTGIKIMIAGIFSFGGTLLFMRLLKLIKLKDAVYIPLVGIMFGNIINAVTTFIAYKQELIQNISSWLQGSFTMVLQGRYELLYLGIPFLLIAGIYADKFTIISMGKDFTKNLGIRYQLTVNMGLVIVAAITSVVLVTIGNIPYIGLIIPNIVSLYRGDNLRGNLLEIALFGALFVLLCDVISRLIIFPFEIPISVIAGIIGCCVFLYLLLGGGKKHAAA